MRITVFVMLISFFNSFAQTATPSQMELKEILLNKSNLIHFINNNLKKNVVNEADSLDNPVGHLKYNLVIESARNYKLLNYPITNIYCYIKVDNKFALYLLLNVSWRKQTDEFIKLLGRPWNVQSLDYDSGDFDMLLWDKKEFKVSITNIFSPFNPDLKLLTITNLPLEDLLDVR